MKTCFYSEIRFYCLLVILLASRNEAAAQFTFVPSIGLDKQNYKVLTGLALINDIEQSFTISIDFEKRINSNYKLGFNTGFLRKEYLFTSGDLPSPFSGTFLYSFGYLETSIYVTRNLGNFSVGIGPNLRRTVISRRSEIILVEGPLFPFENHSIFGFVGRVSFLIKNIQLTAYTNLFLADTRNLELAASNAVGIKLGYKI